MGHSKYFCYIFSFLYFQEKLGEILLSLTYLPSTNTLSIQIIKVGVTLGYNITLNIGF